MAVGQIVQWTTCASFFDAPGYGTQKDGRSHFRLESEPGRGRSSGAERNRVGPNGADRETGEGDEIAIYPVRRHVPTGGQNSRKSSIECSYVGVCFIASNVLRIYFHSVEIGSGNIFDASCLNTYICDLGNAKKGKGSGSVGNPKTRWRLKCKHIFVCFNAGNTLIIYLHRIHFARFSGSDTWTCCIVYD